MTVNELISGINAVVLAGVPDGREVRYGYTCDLLSHVMSHGVAGMAWVTVQTHMNVVAVASLLEFACVLIPESLPVEAPILDKAATEGIVMLSSALTAYEIIKYLADNGVEPAKKA